MQIRRIVQKLISLKNEILRFVASAYYSVMIVIALSVFVGFAYALFPYQDLSLTYMTDPAVILLTIEAAICIFVLITWVMYISYKLDNNIDWHQKMTKRILLQGLYGWIIPFVAILFFIRIRYGQALFGQEHMQFVIAVYFLFLFMLNRHGYIIFLSQRKKSLKEEITLLSQERDRISLELEEQKTQLRTMRRVYEEKQAMMADQTNFLKTENTLSKQKIDDLEIQNRQLLDKLAEQEVLLATYRSRIPEKTYEIKYSASHILTFQESEIAGFVITDKRNEKPLINLFAKDGREVLTNEASLRNVEREFLDMIRLNRWFLVAKDQIVNFTENKETGAAYVTLAFTDEEAEVKKGTWKTIGAQIRTVVSERHEKQKAPNPSPDALI